MEIEMEYADIVIYSIIAIIIIFFIVRKSKKYKKGVIVANAKYVKNTKLYKNLLFKHRIYKALITIFIIIIIMSFAFLAGRTKITQTREVKDNVLIYIEDYYDIFNDENSCWENRTLLRDNIHLNEEKFKKVKSITDKLTDENISIVYRNNYSISEESTSNTKNNSGFSDTISICSFFYGMHLPVVLSSFTDNKAYTNLVLNSIIKYNENDYRFWEGSNALECNGGAVLLDQFYARMTKYAEKTLGLYNYVTSYLPFWGNLLTFPQNTPGLPSGYGRYYWAAWDNAENCSFRTKNATTEEFSNKLSYLDFINERFEKYSNNSNGNKFIIWYTDMNKDSKETTSDILNRVKDYCNENKITVLSIDMMSEDEIVNTIKSSKKAEISEKADIFNLFATLIGILSVILFVLDWRIRI